MSYLSEHEEIDGGYVAFGGDPKGGKITDSECVVLSPNFTLLDERQVLLRISRKNNMYSVNLRNVAPSGGLTCLFEKPTLDESNLWHRRLGHINFKTMNKLVRGNLVRGLPSKIFENDHTCVACLKGKQHKASCRSAKKIRLLMMLERKVLNSKKGEWSSRSNKRSLPVNVISSSFTTVDHGTERTQRNEFENLPTDPLMPDLEDTAESLVVHMMMKLRDRG
nr:ribonuclease H-like domain-containing protein [Tanacetum cinerariifolium]